MLTASSVHQVIFKGSPEGLRLYLPEGTAFDEVLLQLQQRINAGERLWSGGDKVCLECGQRLLDGAQIQSIQQLLQAHKLKLTQVGTTRHQTAVAAAVAGLSVDRDLQELQPVTSSDKLVVEDPLYLQQTIRSGVQIVHNGTIVVLGDVNPGGELLAQGDILVWGSLRGTAHAGTRGNEKALIMALNLAPMQIRIAKYVARAPEDGPAPGQAEVAYISEGNIRIALLSEFGRRR
jgi:septum site-determining protein MinC